MASSINEFISVFQQKCGWPRTFVGANQGLGQFKDEISRILITGITGQDGIYMTAYLLFHLRDCAFIIHGIVRKNSVGLKILL